jgi:DNA-binding transcriptional regulator YiaG
MKNWFKSKSSNVLSLDEFADDLAIMRSYLKEFESQVKTLNMAAKISNERMAEFEKRILKADRDFESALKEIEELKKN